MTPIGLTGGAQSMPPGDPDAEVRRTSGGTCLFVGNGLEAYRVESFETKEPETVAWIRECMTDGEVLIDVGANVGIYALFGAMTHPRSTVFAIEPYLPNVVRLGENVALNGLGNVIVLPIALADRSGLDVFLAPDARVGASGGQLGEPVDEHGRTFAVVDRHPVVMHTLDACVSLLGVPEPHHVKIDVDGAETRVLDGMHETLERPTLRSVLIEVNTDTTDPELVRSLLSDHGFTDDNRFERHPSHSRTRRRGTASESARNLIMVRPSSTRAGLEWR